MGESHADDPLHLDETDERMFIHGATGYGVEVYGGTAEDREATIRHHFEEPLTTIDCREIDTEEAFIETSLRELGVDDATSNKPWVSSSDISRALNSTGRNFALLEFDAMGSDVRRSVAQHMKGIAEAIDRELDIMFGYTCEEGGAVTRSEGDLSGRVRSWQLPSDDEDDPLAKFTTGDEIVTSERDTPMEIQEISPNPVDGRTVIAENHHGRYRLRSHGEGVISMRGMNSEGRLISDDVEVAYAE